MDSSEDRSEIAFFDLETTVPTRTGQKCAILEFGSILVCPKTLVERCSYSTLVKPSDLSLISALTVRRNGISREVVLSAPTFAEIADTVFDILHGRIWAGHNINGFDCPRIREAFKEINRPAPEPKGTIDSLPLLTQRFGRRANNMKMASLANYFGLGEQSHRSLDDVRMNLKVLKYCAAVLFLESGVSTANSWVECSSASPPDPFNRTPPSIEVESGCIQPDDAIMESNLEPLNLSTANSSDAFWDCADFLKPDEICVPSITVVLAPGYRGFPKLQILHNNTVLQVCCKHLKVRFRTSTKFVDSAGRPRLNFVLDASSDLCQVLDAIDDLADRTSWDSGSSSDWWPVVDSKAGFVNSPTIRLHLPWDGNTVRWTTEIYQKESSSTQRIVFSRYDVAELDALLAPGTFVDAYFSLDPYDYQHNAGIHLKAKKLIVHSS